MATFPWIRRRLYRRMSAYLDGELDKQETAALGEHLVFDDEARQEMRAYECVDQLVCAALSPEQRPDPAVLVKRLLRQCHAAEAARPQPRRPDPRWVAAVAVASMGLLITGGVALLGLRRRGLV